MTYRQTGRRLFLTFILTLTLMGLAGCNVGPSLPPTLLPLAQAPLAEPGETAVPLSNRLAIQESRTQRVGLAEKVPTPEGEGIRPQAAQQNWVPDAGPEPPTDWRPPPYQVPLSFHYDDHYWLIRPIPSGRRNYDLEWYPFGNDVQLPELPSYRIHHGVDFPNDTGTPVLAAGSGVVIHAGPLPSPTNGVNYYGNTVVIQHDWQWQSQDVFTLYAHTLELFVKAGDTVEAGQLIAGVGSSGEVSGPHLHFEVRVGRNLYGDARNPALWLAPYEGWGTIAGRFVDKTGEMISSASLTLRPLDNNVPVRKQRTYYPTVRSDDVWRENFVFGDVPAGTYELVLDANDGVHIYRREVTVLPGQTSFEIISTNFEFAPTPAPPTATPEGESTSENE